MATTIKEIADLAGVSTATVSRVVNNNGFVKEKTRATIAALLKKHHYVVAPPQKRQGPKPGKTSPQKYNNFTMIWIGHPVDHTAQGMLHGLSEAAGAVGISLNIEVAPPGGIPEVLNSRKTDGVFLNGNRFSEAFLQKVRSFPVVWLLQAGSHEFGDRVQPDHTQAGIIACQYLRERGCRTLCCVSCGNSGRFPPYWRTREQAFANAAAVDGLECHTITLDYDDDQNNPMAIQGRAAGEVVRRIGRMEKRPDGIFVANSLGFPVYAELTANGIVPTRDIQMVIGDKEVCGGYYNPMPVSIDIHSRGIGELAFETMMQRLHYPDRPPVTCLLKPSLAKSE